MNDDQLRAMSMTDACVLAEHMILRGGTILKNTREARQVKLRELARELDVDAGILSRFETGKMLPKPDVLAKLFRWVAGDGTATAIPSAACPTSQTSPPSIPLPS